jgi:hypothetical protein
MLIDSSSELQFCPWELFGHNTEESLEGWLCLRKPKSFFAAGACFIFWLCQMKGHEDPTTCLRVSHWPVPVLPQCYHVSVGCRTSPRDLISGEDAEACRRNAYIQGYPDAKKWSWDVLPMTLSHGLMTDAFRSFLSEFKTN